MRHPVLAAILLAAMAFSGFAAASEPAMDEGPVAVPLTGRQSVGLDLDVATTVSRLTLPLQQLSVFWAYAPMQGWRTQLSVLCGTSLRNTTDWGAGALLSYRF